MTPFRRPDRPVPRNGYVLLEIIIALTVFAVVVTGLANVLHSSLDGANELRRKAAIRRGLEAVLIEARHKPRREEMAVQHRDDDLGIEYNTSLEELKWVNRNGAPVRGMYVLRAQAVLKDAADRVADSAEVYVYRP